MPRKRVDPVSRPPSGIRPWDQITNRNPSRHYVWANPNDQATGVEYYSSLGYIPEVYHKDGPQPKVAKMLKEGAEITCMGQVLMSCSIEDRMAMESEGAAMAAALEQRIVRPGGVDGFRGIGPGTAIVNETSELETYSGV